MHHDGILTQLCMAKANVLITTSAERGARMSEKSNRTPTVSEAVRALLGSNAEEELVADVIEVVKSYVERPFHLQLRSSNELLLAEQKKTARLEEELRELRAN